MNSNIRTAQVNNKIAAGFILILFIYLLACAPAPSATMIVDDAGMTVTRVSDCKRIVSLSPSNTEIVYSLGLADKLVGVTEYCNYPPEAKAKQRIGGFSTVDIEKVVALQPDLVLAADVHENTVTPMLQKSGFNIVTLKPKTMEDTLNDIILVGKLTSSETAAGKLVDNLRNRIKKVVEKTGGIQKQDRTRTLVVIWHDPLMSAGSGTLIDDLITMCGGNNLAGDIAGHKAISLETVIARDPEVIIVPTSMGTGESAVWDYLKSEPRLKAVSAFKNQRVFKMDGDTIYRYGPRLVDALEQVAEFIHPEIFPAR